MTWKEVNDIVKEFVISLDTRTGEDDPPEIATCDCGFWCVVQEYAGARDNLRNGVLGGEQSGGYDRIEDLAEYVLLKYTEVAQRLIKWTVLRQEDELRLAVDLLIEQGDEQNRRLEKEQQEQAVNKRREDRKRARRNQTDLGLYM